jgi:hypothetical protein
MKINFRKCLNKWAKIGLGYSLFVALSIILIVSGRPFKYDFIYSIWLILFVVWFAYVLLGATLLTIQILIEMLQSIKIRCRDTNRDIHK